MLTRIFNWNTFGNVVNSKRLCCRISILIFLVGTGVFASAQQPSGDEDHSSNRDGNDTSHKLPSEKYNSGWSLFLDNDIVVAQDQEYTGGMSVNLSGRRAAEWPWSLDPVLGLINDVTGVSSLGDGKRPVQRHSFAVGIEAFTPEDITTSQPIEDDHPYAGLVFVNNVRQKIIPSEGISYTSTFSLGVLGSSIPEEAQVVTHNITGSDDPEGWDNQISDGGEPTAQYSLLRQDLLLSSRRNGHFELKSTVGGSAGYITQAQGGLNFRWGRIRTSPWSFNPDSSSYVNMGSPVSRRVEPSSFPYELYLWGGVQGRLIGYNAFIEGQFRDSAVTFDRGELQSAVGEASMGMACGLQNGTKITLGVRGKTREIDDAEGARTLWGTMTISQAY